MTSLLSRSPVAALAAALVAAAASCSDTSTSVNATANLNGPVDVAFACFGGLRILGANGTADETDTVVETGQPQRACEIRSTLDPDDPQRERYLRPEGQENLGSQVVPVASNYAFILQEASGTVALAASPTLAPAKITTLSVNFLDADPLTPGRNVVAVGVRPVGIATDRAGCQLATVNAGSCDLSILDVASFVDADPTTPPLVKTREVVNAAGEPVYARPAAIAAEPNEDTQPIGVECPAEPEGLAYIAYPECHLVAAVRLGTGAIEAAIRYNADGTVEITDGNVSCPAQCGGGGTIEPGTRPTSLDLFHDARAGVGTRRLAIGADNSPTITVVDLGADYLPVSVAQATLVGDVGVLDLALTPQIGMGGSGENNTEPDDVGAAGGQHQFVYAVASDATVRVVDVLGRMVECDTEVDPRFARAVTGVSQLACFEVGNASNPPRRPGARGPGVEFPPLTSPLAVTVGRATINDGTSSGEAMVGYYAYVTAATGRVYIITIDDDRANDLWNAADPIGTQMPLQLPHQLRDGGLNRDAIADADTACGNGTSDEGSPRLSSAGTTLTFSTSVVAQAKAYAMPGIRRQRCTKSDDSDVSVSSLSFGIPAAERDRAFPDLRAALSETWTLIWEGTLSRDDANTALDGPLDRSGVVVREGGDMTVTDPSQPFCDAGVQPWDIVVLTGCDPRLGDAQCGVGEVCYVHPDSTIATGQCLPEDRVDELAASCRDFLVSLRRFSIRESHAGQLRAVPRRRMLPETPIDGCVSDAQCADLAAYGGLMASGEHPKDADPRADGDYRCVADPTRSPGIDRCLMVCESSDDCVDGTVCSGGYCVEGVLPPAQCVPGVQPYQLRAGESFALVGTRTGYLHPIIEDEATGACVVDPAASPLLTGRVPLDVPPCPADDDVTTLTPNPCLTTVSHTESVQIYLDPATCTTPPSNQAQTRLVTRDAPAIRVKNPAMTFDLVDPWFPGDAVCRGDRGGTLDRVPVVHIGMAIQIPIVSGWVPLFAVSGSALFAIPSNIVRGPSGSIWVVDEGDDLPDSSSDAYIRGQVVRFEPSRMRTNNFVQ